MKKLFKFFIQNSVFFLFLLLEYIALVFVVNNNEYQRSTYFSSANSSIAQIYKTTDKISEYFRLKKINTYLAEENNMLRNRIIDIENKYSTYIPAPNEKTDGYIDADKAITCLSARVINNSTQKLKNYITLNKGRRDGIKAGMGVIVAQGTVGIVKGVSDKFSVVIPILNPEINISAKFKNSGYIGLLEWDGLNPGYAQLKGIARHINVNRGDSLITSGLTTNFPVGLQVGVVDEFELDENDSYYTIRVKLAVNFKTLSHVTVLENRNAEEQKQLEQENYTN